jgi:hypothetical protein
MESPKVRAAAVMTKTPFAGKSSRTLRALGLPRANVPAPILQNADFVNNVRRHLPAPPPGAFLTGVQRIPIG